MQEFMLFPFGAANFTEAMKMGSETYHHLKTIIKKKFGQDATNVGDEGGFAPNILVNTDALDLIVDAIEVAGYKGKIGICMDPAASEFWNNDLKKYDLGEPKNLYLFICYCNFYPSSLTISFQTSKMTLPVTLTIPTDTSPLKNWLKFTWT